MGWLCFFTIIAISCVSIAKTEQRPSATDLDSQTWDLSVPAKKPEFLDWLKRVRRRIHEYPDLAFQEHETGQLIMSELDLFGIDYSLPVAETGIVASVGSGVEPWFGLRADMDSLPIQVAFCLFS
ncbi:IAA-amino acid hydrolase ILR1-like [Hibiscus syriacus]|uniref:IAA-amino acid hydrolase ILR1-like n=1 Tax=Hibiscus syriacus TaxID=106335 RepID=UPI0019227BEF|nr:IAA-amino acid hydrolase ILR1-like [Hibiscus syriacus]